MDAKRRKLRLEPIGVRRRCPRTKKITMKFQIQIVSRRLHNVVMSDLTWDMKNRIVQYQCFCSKDIVMVLELMMYLMFQRICWLRLGFLETRMWWAVENVLTQNSKWVTSKLFKPMIFRQNGSWKMHLEIWNEKVQLGPFLLHLAPLHFGLLEHFLKCVDVVVQGMNHGVGKMICRLVKLVNIFQGYHRADDITYVRRQLCLWVR